MNPTVVLETGIALSCEDTTLSAQTVHLTSEKERISVGALRSMSLFTHLSKVVEASGKKSLLGLIFSFEGLKIFADGNIAWVSERSRVER